MVKLVERVVTVLGPSVFNEPKTIPQPKPKKKSDTNRITADEARKLRKAAMEIQSIDYVDELLSWFYDRVKEKTVNLDSYPGVTIEVGKLRIALVSMERAICDAIEEQLTNEGYDVDILYGLPENTDTFLHEEDWTIDKERPIYPLIIVKW